MLVFGEVSNSDQRVDETIKCALDSIKQNLVFLLVGGKNELF